MNRQVQVLRRRQLDRQITTLAPHSDVAAPRTGWLRSIRDCLGISSYQLARKLGKSQTHVVQAERREAAGTISLNTLREIANSLDCDLVYALIPRHGTLEARLKSRARQVATGLISSVNHTMALEKQEETGRGQDDQIEELAEELIRTRSRELWDNFD